MPTGGSSAYNWATFHGSPLLTGYASSSTLSASTAGQLGVGWATDLYGPALDSPVVAYDATLEETVAYVGTENGDLEAVDVATGQIVWGTWVGGPIRSTPLVNGGAVWFGTEDSPRVYKLNATTGALDCEVAAPQPIEGTPVFADPPGGSPTVYIGTNDSASSPGPMLAIAASNCGIEWSFTAYSTLSGSWTPCAYAIDASGEPLIVFGTADPDSTVYAVDAVTGAKVWSYAVENPPPGVYDIGAGALITPPGLNGFPGGAVYVPSKYGVMYALDLTTGALIWSTDFNQIAGYSGESGRSTAAISGTNLVFGYGRGMFDLDPLTGAVLWQYVDPTGTETLSSPAIAGPTGQEIVAAGDLAGNVNVLSLRTGVALFSYATGGYITASPAVSAGNLLVASSDGFLYDLVVGGGDEGTPPATTVSSPVQGAVLPNPGGDLTVHGTATDQSGLAGVAVAVQEDGTSGGWWDATTGGWSSGPVENPATLASPDAKASEWSFALPVPAAGGSYSVVAYAQSIGGQSDIHAAHVELTVLSATKGPHLRVSPVFVPPGTSVTVSASGFQPLANVSIALVNTVLLTTTANSKGYVPAVRVKIPASAAFGPSSVVATGVSTGGTATSSITIANAWAQLGDNSSHTGFAPNDSTLFNLVHPGGDIFLDPSWDYQTGSAVETSPAIADGVAYVGNEAGQVTAIDIHNGAAMWTWSDAARDAIDGSPSVDPKAGLVFVGADDGSLDALSTSSGALKWSINVGGEVSAPVLSGGSIYVTSTAGLIEAVTESGGKQWQRTLASTTSAAPSVDGTAKVVVVGESNGSLQEFDASTGAAGWVFTAAGAIDSPPALESGAVYVGSSAGFLYAISESTGAKRWTFAAQGAIDDTPALTNRIVPSDAPEIVFGDSTGHLYFLRASDAVVNYVLHFASGVSGVAVVKGVAIAELTNGEVTAARTYTDLDTWKYRTTSGLSTAPAIVDGAVYVGAGDGKLYAFTSYGQPPA